MGTLPGKTQALAEKIAILNEVKPIVWVSVICISALFVVYGVSRAALRKR